jgi:hypothetical protein
MQCLGIPDPAAISQFIQARINEAFGMHMAA